MPYLKQSVQLSIVLLSGLFVSACGGGGGESPAGSTNQANGSQLSDYAGSWLVDPGVVPEGLRISGMLIDDDGYMSFQYFVDSGVSPLVEVIFFGFADVINNRLVVDAPAISRGPVLGGVRPYSRDSISIDVKFASDGDLLVSVEHPEGGFDAVRFSYNGPLNPGEFSSLLTTNWYTNPFLFNSSEVPWELSVDLQGIVTGAYAGSCALTGAIEPSMHDGFLHRLSLDAGGCIDANSFYGTIFAFVPSSVSGLVAVMYVVNEEGQPDLIEFRTIPPPL